MHNERRRGFSLVEVVVALVIGSLVMGVAYGIWSRVRREVARSQTRQMLQHELRVAADSITADLKAIKSGTMTGGQQAADGSRVHFEFDRFKKTEDNKLAEDSVEHVAYDFTGALLIRTCGPNRRVFSTHLTSLELTRGVNQATAETTNVAGVNPDYDRALNARLDIALTGKKQVPGSKIVEFHIERTSAVMREEYQKTVNKSYLSTNELAKLGKGSVVQGGPNSNFLENNGTMTEEQLRQLSREQLAGLEQSQQNMLTEAQKCLDDMNKNIGDINTGGGLTEKINIFGWKPGSSDVREVNELQSAIEGAQKKEDLTSALKQAETYIKGKEETFYGRSYPGINISGMSDAEKKVYQMAYDLKVQDRSMDNAYKEMVKSKPDTQKPPSAVETATAIPARLPEGQETEQQYQARCQEAQKLKEACDKVNLTWMGDPADESKEVKAYNAAKTLYNYGQAKSQLLGMRDDAKTNLTAIHNVQGRS